MELHRLRYLEENRGKGDLLLHPQPHQSPPSRSNSSDSLHLSSSHSNQIQASLLFQKIICALSSSFNLTNPGRTLHHQINMKF
jgi:hypothetical protein